MLSENNPKIDENKSHPAKKIAPHHNRNTAESQNPRGNQNPNSDAELNPMLIHEGILLLSCYKVKTPQKRGLIHLSENAFSARRTILSALGGSPCTKAVPISPGPAGTAVL